MISKQKTKIYLVGAGPGDPGLLTLRAHQLLQKADIIFYDHLISSEILDLIPEKTKKVYVGKRGEIKACEQEQIEDLLVDASKQYKQIVRLKGGDPFIFGRGGEEAQRLEKEGIAYEMVPGISSAIAAPAYAGIPVTHRDYASNLAIMTGHLAATGNINWKALAGIDTLILLMSVKNIRQNCDALAAAGKSLNTPMACIRWASTPKQEVFLSTLEGMPNLIEKNKIMPPLVFVLGEVAKLAEQMPWLRHKVLFGKKIFIACSERSLEEIKSLFQGCGAALKYWPALIQNSLLKEDGFLNLIKKITHYDWLFFTSSAAIELFFESLIENHLDLRSLHSIKIAVLGKRSAEKLLKYGIDADLISQEANGQSLAQDFISQYSQPQKILFLQAKEGAKDWLEFLREQGHEIDKIPFYENAAGRLSSNDLQELAESEALVFSSAQSLLSICNQIEDEEKSKLKQKSVFCLGEKTAQLARTLGFAKVYQTSQNSYEELVCLLEDYL